MSRTDVTVGIDIGTTAVKAVAADGDGRVLARVRVPHELRVPEPDRMEHDADAAWRRGPLTALTELGASGRDARAVAVAAMVPSLTAVDAQGRPLTPGLLYGDRRGRNPRDAQFLSGETAGFLRWTAAQAPEAAGYWPAAAVANYALAGEAVVDTTTASTMYPVFDGAGWAEHADRMPRVAATGSAVGQLLGSGGALGAGAVDALCEQLVAGTGHDGDVLVLCGTTLIVWVTVPEYREVPGVWTLPHTVGGKYQIGGPSNAGGLFLNWVDRVVRDADPADADPGRIPLWAPYIRGERVPLHEPGRRAGLAGADLTHDSAALRRAAYEASGFVVRRLIELSGAAPARIVATGGGSRVAAWMQAIADATGRPVHVSAVPDGAALGAAYLARMAVGLETSTAGAQRWAATDRVVDPDPAWTAPTAERYGRFLETGSTAAPR